MNIRPAQAGRALSFVVLAGVCAVAPAQEYPVKAIRFIAPNLPGGPTDILARLIGQKLAESFSQPVVIENRAGAGGNIGTELAAKSPPDGYTLVTGNNATFGANVSLYKNLGFDPIKDFAPIVLVATQPNILVVHPSLPVRSVKELIAFAKARPGQLNYANSGMGAAAHLSAELFKSMTGTDIVSIPYKSAAPALLDLIAGQSQLMFATSLSVQPHIKAAKLRALAVTTAKRSRLMPELPTIAEAGVPGFEAMTWHGVLTIGGTPPAIVNKLNAEINRILQRPDVRERLGTLGAEIIGGTPKEFADHIQREIPKSYSHPIGMDALDEALANWKNMPSARRLELRGSEDNLLQDLSALRACQAQIDGIRQTFSTAWMHGFQKYRQSQHEVKRWKEDARVFVIGGGSLVTPVREAPREHPQSRSIRLPVEEMECPSDLELPGTKTVPKEALPFLTVAYGLSNLGLAIPEVRTPDEIEPLSSTEQRRMQFDHEDIYAR